MYMHKFDKFKSIIEASDLLFSFVEIYQVQVRFGIHPVDSDLGISRNHQLFLWKSRKQVIIISSLCLILSIHNEIC
jgi:hypothetical protein